jgi:small subunit ribosomal protein S17
MTDEPDTDTSPDEPGTPAPDAPAAETPAVEAPDTAAAEASEAPAEQAAQASATSEPEPSMSSKERRRSSRSKHAGDTRPPRSPEQRHAERLLERRKKAIRRRARRLQERAKAAERSRQDGGTQTGEGAQLAPVHALVEGTRKVRQGIVVSDKAEKTITVRIDVARRHRRYKKIVRSSNTLHAHDENNDAHEGDIVRVIESRPLSRTKRWRLVDVLERAQ